MASLNFKGKSAVWNHHLSVPYHTLDKDKKYSLAGADENENLIIEGDNLLALKALLPKYQGKVKCIYIDPPYNTGNEGWVYNDNVNNPIIKEWIGQTVGKEGEDLTRHDKWLCMMTPRLKLLRDLLSNDGVIFVSIDDHEVSNLRLLMDEIFREENFVGIYSWVKTQTPENLSKKTRQMVEYVLCYEKEKNDKKFKGIIRSSNTSNGLLNQSNSVKELIFPANIVSTRIKNKILKAGAYGTDNYEVELLNDVEIKDGFFAEKFTLRSKFKWTQSKIDEEIGLGTKIMIPKETLSPAYLKDQNNPQVPVNLIDDEVGVGTNENAKAELREIFGFDTFEYPKPSSLVKYLIGFVSEKNDIILDSFAGSGTTAQSVLEFNQEDKEKRQFILIQLPEEVKKKTSSGQKNPAYEADYRFVHEITRDRVKKVIARDKLKVGFTYYKLGPSVDGKSILEGKDLPTWENFAKYVHYLATGKPIDEVKKPTATWEIISKAKPTGIYLLYKDSVEELKELAITRDWLESIKDKEGKKIVYAPACFLDKEVLDEHNIAFVQIPFNLFQRK